MKISIRLIAAGALMAAGLPLTASAQTVTISATVASQCNLGTAAVDLGALTLDTFKQNTATNLSLTCNKGATPFVAMSDGAHSIVAGQKRLLGTSGDFMAYNISVPTITGTTSGCPGLPGGTEWTTTNRADATTMFAASGGVRQLLLCVYVPAGQGFNFGAGTYTDTVTATVSFS